MGSRSLLYAPFPKERGADATRLEHMVRQALASGAKVAGVGVVHWHIEGQCADPYIVYQTGVVPGVNAHLTDIPFDTKGRSSYKVMLKMWVPCRNCKYCLRQRAARWRFDATSEIEEAERTWFVTLTGRPEAQYRYVLGFKADEKSKLTLERQEFKYRAKKMLAEATLFLKRLRKQSGAKLRYCLVVEEHKSGLPHLHALIHEVRGTVTHRNIDACWRDGFHKSVLVDKEAPKAAAYVTKYLSKSMLARVRASQHYGTPRR